jgi:hypothetical protein
MLIFERTRIDSQQPAYLEVSCPNWVGDNMATPYLSVAENLPGVRISALTCTNAKDRDSFGSMRLSIVRTNHLPAFWRLQGCQTSGGYGHPSAEFIDPTCRFVLPE